MAGESLGTRSMATYIEVKRLKIFIDPGVALGPWRYGLPPHDLELEAKERAWRDIVRYASKADIVIVTHYHYDHHNPWDSLEEIYRDKKIFLKDYDEYINPSQIRRSRYFLHRLEEVGIDMDDISKADNTRYAEGGVKIEFSPPFPHGDTPKLGYVVMVRIDDGDNVFLYTSDVEGVMDPDALKYIMGSGASLILMDGPPTYLNYDEEAIEMSFRSIKNVLSMDSLNLLILDHHFTRDRNYIDILGEKLGESDMLDKVVTIAEYMGRKPLFLEAYRDVLHETGEYPG